MINNDDAENDNHFNVSNVFIYMLTGQPNDQLQKQQHKYKQTTQN
jgi:hypothetical protein